MFTECWIDKWSNWFLEENLWRIWWWFCMSFAQITLNNFTFSCCSPIIFRHFLNWLYRYTICKLTISFSSSRIRCCNPMNLKNCFLLPLKGKLLVIFLMLVMVYTWFKDALYTCDVASLFLQILTVTFYIYAFPESNCQLVLLAMLFDILWFLIAVPGLKIHTWML
jgi:hypothetical protein